MLESYPWHEKAWFNVNKLIESGRFPHALLLWGQLGLGKKFFARQLANNLLCLTNKLSCGTCQGCHWYQQGVHPDFISLEPLKGKKKINVEQIRDLQTILSLSRTQKTPRVILVSMADQMNLSASNALLKSLEEPNEACVYLLVANDLSNIPATIQSRCQTLYFPPAHLKDVQAYLGKCGKDMNQARLLSGSPLLANELLSAKILADRSMIINELLQLIAGEISPCNAVSKWNKAEDLFVLRVLYEWFSDLIKWSCGVTGKALIHQEQQRALEEVVMRMEKKLFFTVLDKIVQMIGHLTSSRQINTSLWFDDLAITIINK